MHSPAMLSVIPDTWEFISATDRSFMHQHPKRVLSCPMQAIVPFFPSDESSKGLPEGQEYLTESKMNKTGDGQEWPSLFVMLSILYVW